MGYPNAVLIQVQFDPNVARRVPVRIRRELPRRLERAARRMGFVDGTQAVVRVIDDAAMTALHGQHMGKAKTTDVLAFPAGGDEEEVAGDGDVALCWDAVCRQARIPGPAGWLAEAVLLCVHGLAHLQGHDHGDRAEGRRMHRLERRGLQAARVPDSPRPYHPWSGGRS